jgi:hypothetical protein
MARLTSRTSLGHRDLEMAGSGLRTAGLATVSEGRLVGAGEAGAPAAGEGELGAVVGASSAQALRASTDTVPARRSSKQRANLCL